MVSFYNPVKVSFLSIEDFKNKLLNDSKNKKIALFANTSMLTRLNLLELINELEKVSVDLIWINDTKSNPTYIDIYNKLLLFKNKEIDDIYAIGGGSVIDTAKVIKALYFLVNKNDLTSDEVLNIIDKKDYVKYQSEINLYAIPTTAGTGSEMTKWATVWDNINHKKYSVETEYLYPNESYLIPEFTILMPPLLTISTGLDALSHAMESFWAKSTNEIVKGIALSSIKLIVEYLPKVKEDFNNLEYRKKMLTGSTLAGLAFSQTRTTAAHSISYPLTSLYNIEHGLAVALSLPYIMEINMQEVDDIKEILNVFNVSLSIEVRDWILQLCKPYVDLRLSAFGINEEDINNIIQLSFTQGRMNNNPVDISVEQIKNLLLKLL